MAAPPQTSPSPDEAEFLEPSAVDDLKVDDLGDALELREPVPEPGTPEAPRNGRRGRTAQAALPAAESEPEIDARPNLLETVAPAADVAPEFDEELEYDEYEDDYGEGYYYREDQLSLLRNPYVLAGLAVALAIVMAVAVVFLFGRGNDEAGGGGGGGNVPQTQAPRPGGGNAIPGAVAARSIATATVREGPGLDYLELGLLRANQDVQVMGRNQESTWYQIVYPRDSQLRGWVPKSALNVPDATMASLAVVTVTPIERPTVVLPTSTPRPAEPTPTPEPTQSANDRADIGVVISADCSAGSDIRIVINNVGNVPIDHTVQVIVSNNGLVEYDRSFAAKIVPGQSVALNTEVKAKAPSMTVTVLLQGLQDVSAVNNIASCQVSGSSGNTGGNNNSGGTNVPPPIGTPGN